MARRGLRAHGQRGLFRPWQRVLAGLLVLIVLTVVCFFRCRTAVYQFAKNSAAWRAEKAANESVAQVLAQHADLCRSLISVSYNTDNVLASVVLDSAGMNVLKTAASAAIMDALADMHTLTVHIPLATLLRMDWMSGLGPRIAVPLSITGSVFTNITSSLEESGMNQTAYRVNIHVKIGLWLVTPAGYADVTVETAFPMAEAVLLGEVPENFTQVYGDSQDTIGEIFDYGTLND